MPHDSTQYVAIPLTRGMFAHIDSDDVPLVQGYRWYAYQGPSGIWYAATKPYKSRTIIMHRLILASDNTRVVDHRDGNGLNNRRANLRVAKQAQNRANSRKQRNNTSGFKGVSRSWKNTSWRATIRENGKQTHLGYFRTPEEAARAYDRAARALFGEFARLNYPEEYEDENAA